MRRKFRWDRTQGCLVEVPIESRQVTGPFVQGDLPAYESPIDGRIIDGRKARREDLKRNGCRPWEGMEQEKKEAAKRQAQQERQLDSLAEKMAYRAWDQAPERIRKVFRSR